MNILNKLVELLVVGVAILFISILLITNPVYAKNITAGFSAGTLISTPDGEVAVEELEPGDRIIGYSFATHQIEENVIKDIQQKSSLSYYLINNKIGITGTSFVYIKTKNEPKLVTVQQLRIQAKLFSPNHSSIITQSVEQIVTPTDVYEVILENKEGNLFANKILIHNGDKIPASLRKQYLLCDYSNLGVSRSCSEINSDSFPGFIKALSIWMVGIVLLGTVIARLLIYIPNFIRFYGKHFTDDVSLIRFTKDINPKFANKYSVRYQEGSKVWYMIPLQPKIAPDKYHHLIEETELIRQLNDLFIQYHQDLINKNFDGIGQYFPDFDNNDKYQKYRQSFINDFNIIDQPKIIDTAVIDFKREVNEVNIFRVQVNAETINFAISNRGYVLTGKPQVQQYSEYWDLELISENKCIIKAIEDTLTTVILQGDLQAKREAYGSLTGV